MERCASHGAGFRTKFRKMLVKTALLTPPKGSIFERQIKADTGCGRLLVARGHGRRAGERQIKMVFAQSRYLWRLDKLFLKTQKIIRPYFEVSSTRMETILDDLETS